MAASNVHLAIVGVTGAVGQEFLKVLEQRHFPIGKLTLLASTRSAGRTITFRGKSYTVEALTEQSFAGVDIALFSAGGSISKQYVPAAVAAGAVVVDNSSAFRQRQDVPLIVPEVNADAMKHVKLGSGAIIANPNCSTIIALVPVSPLHRAATVRRMVVSTYQAASGAGAAAMAELEQQTREVLAGKPPTCNIFRQQYAFNLFSHNSSLSPQGYNEEEMKLIHETHKIWGYTQGTGSTVQVDPPADNGLPRISATCVRVPVMRAHAESITLTFEKPMTEQQARELLAAAPGVALVDDRENNCFPTPLDASDRDDVLVGRIRRDLSQPDDRGLSMFICGDQIRKGAALNAVQIAELLV